jgi:hypothetical protein
VCGIEIMNAIIRAGAICFYPPSARLHLQLKLPCSSTPAAPHEFFGHTILGPIEALAAGSQTTCQGHGFELIPSVQGTWVSEEIGTYPAFGPEGWASSAPAAARSMRSKASPPVFKRGVWQLSSKVLNIARCRSVAPAPAPVPEAACPNAAGWSDTNEAVRTTRTRP